MAIAAATSVMLTFMYRPVTKGALCPAKAWATG
jgi:hypothetical protein